MFLTSARWSAGALTLASGAVWVWLIAAGVARGVEALRLADSLVARSWATKEGLPQNSVNAIVQTREGYLWLGTRDGLARFDGVRFEVFGLQEGLPSVDIAALYEDRRGVLWIGTIGGGLSRWAAGRIETVTSPSRQMGGDTVTSLTEDAEGRLWVGTAAGLKLWVEGEFVQNETTAAFAGTPIRALLRDRRGVMWVATAVDGLYEIKDSQPARLAGPPGNEKVLAYRLLEDREGRLWASVGNGKVLCRQGGIWRVYSQADGLPFAYVTSLAEESDGTIWAGSLDDGLYYFRGGQFKVVKREDGLSANDIRSLLVDREGNLWVGTRTGGLNRLSQRRLAHVGAAQGLTNDYTRSVTQSDDGTIWVATTGGGLYRGGLEGFKPFAPEFVFQFYAQTESVLALRDGSLWCGGARALLCWRAGRLAGCFTNESWISSASATALCDDRRGGVWVGTSEGRLVHLEQNRATDFRRQVARGPITALAVQTNGNLWVGSVAGGLRRVREASEEILWVTNGLLSSSIRALYLDREDTLWIGTAGGGLSRWRDGRGTSFTAAQGLTAKTVSQIVEDDLGYLWLGSNRGIFRVGKRDLEDLAAGLNNFVRPRVYGVGDGMPVEECSSGFCPAGLKTESGLICFSTVKGLVFLDPRRQEPNAAQPVVLLEEVLVNGRILTRGPGTDSAEPGAGDSPVRQRMIIPPGGRDVELHYTGISFAAPEKMGFRYKLEGLDPDWVEAGVRRTAYYQRIPPGDFTFRVRACNADGVWSEQGAALAITVQPYFWQTRWFPVGLAVVVLGLVTGSLRLWEQRRYRRRLALLQTQHAIEKERLRISQDMHDHIGGMLTQVSQLSDLGQAEAAVQPATRGHFERIGSQARAAVQALDEIVWATNPKNDNLPRFADYVSRFADEFFENTSVRCWQEMPPNLPNVPLRADVRHNVFLALKESLNNVLKHSGATELWLRLGLDQSAVALEIEDNGRGFTPGAVASAGNGLGNMHSRLEDSGGQAEVDSSPGRGTRIRLVFPLPPAAEPVAG